MHEVFDSAGLRRTRASARHIVAFQFLSHRRLIPDVGRFQSSIPSLHIPLSTLRLRSCGRPRMTRGQDGSLLLFLYDSFIHYSMPVYPDAHEESTMPNNTISTRNKGETPYAIVKLTPGDLEGRDWSFLREWANNLGVSLEVLLHRILVAAIIGQLYVEKIPEI